MKIRRSDLIALRFRRHQLDLGPDGERGGPADVDLLDLGVQDTGPDGAAWALAIRGGPATLDDDLALAWTWRGAPHAYRRRDLAAIAVATAPYSEADAAKRVFDAAKPLKAAGIPVLDALRTVAGQMREIVRRPTSKGEVSSRLTERLDEPYLRECRPCATIHIFEQPFRLSALQAGLELEPGTSPPVLRRIPGWRAEPLARLAGEADPRFDPILTHLRFFPGARLRDVATFLDAPQKEVRARWPEDAVGIEVADDPTPGKAEPRFVLAPDLDDLGAGGAEPEGVVRLLGPYDPYLQLRDRELLVDDEPRRKDLWRVLGRPGAVVRDGEVVGTWRPRTSGRKLTVLVERWGRWPRTTAPSVGSEAERLAAHREVELAGVEVV